jgi:predicted methyltransferase
MKRSVIGWMAAVALAVAAGGALAGDVPSYVTQALADPTRPKDDIAADALRDPADTLAFAGVRPGMTVAELSPAGGYFQRLISDVVGASGHDYGLENSIWTDSVTADRKLMAEPGRGNISLDVEPWGQFQLPAKVDLFWITQNYHDLHIAKYGVVDIAAFNRRVFEALKPGGVYFILDHQANPGETDAELAQLHRIEKARVIREVTAAGFRLVAEGTFLNRPADDHTRTIFDPAIRGHTDQYALKFVRP